MQRSIACTSARERDAHPLVAQDKSMSSPRMKPSATGRRPMTVKAILSRKGTDVVTTDPNASVAEVAKILASRRIGAVVATGADRHIVGILSERDIVRAIGEKGPAALGLPIAEIMTRKVITCTAND